MIKVLTFGVFDYFHLGHLQLFEQAKQHGDYLTVAVQEEAAIALYKPEAEVCYSTTQRIHLLHALRIVDEVCTYRHVDVDIQGMDFDVLALGQDQNHAGFMRARQWCLQHGKSVVVLQRTPAISSTNMKGTIQKLK